MNGDEIMNKKILAILALVSLSILSIFIGVHDLTYEILIESRIPRLLSILLTGMGMGIAGLIMMQISQNKFASPSTTGTIECAGLGIILCTAFIPDMKIGFKVMIIFALALIGTKIFTTILDKIVFKDTLFIPLIGIMYGNIITAITTMIAYEFNLLQELSIWFAGDFSAILHGKYELLYFIIPGVIVAYLYANALTIIGFGQDFSENLGISYNKIKNLGLFIVAFLVASIVTVVGQIPFIGLIIPNLATLMNGDNIKTNLPYIVIFGCIYVLICDILSRVLIFPYEISVSLISGLFGSIIFMGLILRGKNNA
jgi:iron complex transport system permease protein